MLIYCPPRALHREVTWRGRIELATEDGDVVEIEVIDGFAEVPDDFVDEALAGGIHGARLATRKEQAQHGRPAKKVTDG